MEKKKLLISLGCLIVIIIVLGAIVFSGTDTEMPLAEQLIIGPSDEEETGLSTTHGSDGSDWPHSWFNNDDSFYERSLVGDDFIVSIYVAAFNSTALCQSEYSRIEAQYQPLGENGTTALELYNGTGHGFILQDSNTSQYCEIYYMVDEVIVGMVFYSVLQHWDEDLLNEKAIPVAEFQCQKIVKI